MKSTMLGIAPPPSQGEGRGTPEQPLKRTMLGVVPDAAMTPMREQLARKAVEALASGSGAPPLAPSAEPPPTAAPLMAPAPARAAPRVAKPERKVSPKSDRTMLGVPGSAAVAIPPTQGGESPLSEPPSEPPSAPRLSASDELASPRKRRRRRGLLRLLLAALGGALVVLALGLVAFQYLSDPGLSVRVVQGEGGEALEVAVPAAPPGARVRFLGAEQELRGGLAQFPLAADALALGSNELTIGIVRGSEVETTQVRLQVAYRARVDSSALAREPPQLDVVIEALPGSKVTLDGQSLALDRSGRGVRSYPVGPQSGSKLEFEARYRIEPPEGVASEGVLTLGLPVTSLQIDRPGPSLVTDQATIEVAGAVETGAKLTVDGQPVRIHENRFVHRVRLKPGQHTIRVLASSQGKAPRTIDLAVTRVADLKAAAQSFEADPALTYGRIAQNPVMYRGQNVAFDGRVYNVEVKGGQSHLQLLVRDCAGGRRCPLWVELSQATDVTVDTWVRVLGTVAGEQQFRSERGQVHTVPSVRAQYVLKLPR